MGLETFCESDWQLPPEAKAFRAARQTYTWTPKETWEDCERHARDMMNEAEWTAFEEELGMIGRGEKAEAPASPKTDPTEADQPRLF